jgi:hypothetical protein
MDNYKLVQFMHFDKYVITQLPVDIQTKQYYVLMIICANKFAFVCFRWVIQIASIIATPL